MAKEYIEREAALLEIEEWAGTFCECDYVWSHVIKSIQKLSAADVRPVVRGRWVDSKLDGVPSHCSECNYPIDRFYKTRFCPNCGADMEEAKT